jgi:hypothetical protein
MKTKGQNLRFGMKPVISFFLTGMLCIVNIVLLAWTAWTEYDAAQKLFSLPFFGIFAFLGYHVLLHAHTCWVEYKTQKPYDYYA